LKKTFFPRLFKSLFFKKSGFFLKKYTFLLKNIYFSNKECFFSSLGKEKLFFPFHKNKKDFFLFLFFSEKRNKNYSFNGNIFLKIFFYAKNFLSKEIYDENYIFKKISSFNFLFDVFLFFLFF